MVFTIAFNYQSHTIDFSDWATLLTLCLAPLIAHVVAGVPPPVYLHGNKPRWHDRICLYNPTSILWRYLAIVDRRSRAKSWTRLDLAASNAIFWDGEKWNGSEEMIQRSRDFCVRTPKHHHIELLSSSTLITLIVTLQGLQAVYSIIDGSVSHSISHSYSARVSIGTIFFPLAWFGLLRLPAALWLTNDYIYRHNEDWDLTRSLDIELTTPKSSKEPESARVLELAQTTSFLDSPSLEERFHSHRGWPTTLLRSFYMIMIMGPLALCLWLLLRDANHSIQKRWTLTNFSLVLTFLLFLSATAAIMLRYIYLNHCRSTIIPCIAARWYKVYTYILFATMFCVFVLAGLETRKTPCGVFTTYSEASTADYVLCGQSTFIEKAHEHNTNSTAGGGHKVNGTTVLHHNSVPYNESYGIAMKANDGNIVVLAFNGWCRIDSALNRTEISIFQPLNFTLI